MELPLTCAKHLRWYCSICGKTTPHRIPDNDSSWVYQRDIPVYRRWRACDICGSPNGTVEMTSSDLYGLFRIVDEALARAEAAEQMTELVKDTGAEFQRELRRFLNKFKPSKGK